MTTKRSERLLYLIDLFQGGRRYAVAELADLAGVSERTIYRDIVDLSFLVPIYYDDGYRLLGEATLTGVALTRDELLALRLGLTVPPLSEGSHLTAATRSALAKIESILVKRFDEPVDDLAKSIDINIPTAAISEKIVEHLRLLESSIINRKSVIVEYKSPLKVEASVRKTDPYGLSFRRHAWYVVAYCHLRKDLRLFRIDRILSAKPTGEPFARPAGFSIEKYFEGAWELSASGELYNVVIEFAESLGHTVAATYGRRGRFVKLKGGGFRFTFEVHGLDEIFRWVLAYGAGARVVEPPELVAAVRNEAERMFLKYDG